MAWLFSTPLDRAGLLRRRLAAAVAAGMAASVTLGVAFLAVTRLDVPLPQWLTMWAAAGAVEACACVVVQARGLKAQRGLTLAAHALVAALAAILVLRPGHLLTGLSPGVATGCAAAVVLERRVRAVARVRPAPISGHRFRALVIADLARVLRMPTGLLVWGTLI